MSSSGASGDSDLGPSSNKRAKRSAGIWETRLQTNVNMTRMALSQALTISASARSTPVAATAASWPQARFGSTLMATPLVPSSGDIKSISYRFTNPLILDHRLNIGPDGNQASTGATTDHVFSANNIAKMLDNWTSKSPVCAVSEQEANSSTPVVAGGSDVGCLYFANTAAFSDVMTLNHRNININSVGSVVDSSVAAPLDPHPRVNIDVHNAGIPSFTDIEDLLVNNQSVPLHPAQAPSPPARAPHPAAYDLFGQSFLNV